MFMTIKQASKKWGISDRRVRVLCSEGKIPGAYQDGRSWKIPSDAVRPADGRYRSRESILPKHKKENEWEEKPVHIIQACQRHLCIWSSGKIKMGERYI